MLFFLQNESSLFSRAEWRKLISVESNISLLEALLRQNKAIGDTNVNVLKVVFLSLDFHIFECDNGIDKSNRNLMAKLFQLIGCFYTFQTQNASLFVSSEDDESSSLLISEQMRTYFVSLLRDDFFNKFHRLSSASERKLILQTLLVLDRDFLFNSILDREQFIFYKGTMSALLTQEAEQASKVDFYLLNAFCAKNDLFVPSAFASGDDNLFQRKSLNEWRFERIKAYKSIRSEQWTEDGNTKGPLFEWRKGGSREGAGIHPRLNDVDTDKPNEVDPSKQIVFDTETDCFEDYAMLLPNDEVDCKKILLRSACDLMLEYKQNDESKKPIAIFFDDSSSQIRRQFYENLCDLMGAKCLFIDKKEDDMQSICDKIQCVL